MRSVVIVAALLGLGCQSPDVEVAEVGPPAYWHGEVREIALAKCATCHYPGSATPLDLTTYADFVAHRSAVEGAIAAGDMPPWLPARGCNRYLDDRSLREHEKDSMLRWLRQGAPEGERPVTPETPYEPVRGALPRVDVEITMPTAYTPRVTKGNYDDGRCFILDWPYSEDVVVNGLEVVPGNVSIVHHVIVMTISPDRVTEFTEHDDADPLPGYECNDGFGELPSGVAGGWVPGDNPKPLPNGFGGPIEGGSKILLHMHYNMLYAEPGPDQTRIRFMLTDAYVPFFGVPLLNTNWIDAGMPIKAGDPDAVFKYQYEPTIFTGGWPIRLHNVWVHMHQLGERARVEIIRADGSSECLLDIPKWNFFWQTTYWFEDAPLISDDDELYIECEFDNSAGHQVIVDGKRIEPRDINWGGAAPDEMCAAVLGASIGP